MSQVRRNQGEDTSFEHWCGNDPQGYGIISSTLWCCNQQTIYGQSQAPLGLLDGHCPEGDDKDQAHKESRLRGDLQVDLEGVKGNSRRHHQVGFPEMLHIQCTQHTMGNTLPFLLTLLPLGMMRMNWHMQTISSMRHSMAVGFEWSFYPLGLVLFRTTHFQERI